MPNIHNTSSPNYVSYFRQEVRRNLVSLAAPRA